MLGVLWGAFSTRVVCDTNIHWRVSRKPLARAMAAYLAIVPGENGADLSWPMCKGLSATRPFSARMMVLNLISTFLTTLQLLFPVCRMHHQYIIEQDL